MSPKRRSPGQVAGQRPRTGAKAASDDGYLTESEADALAARFREFEARHGVGRRSWNGGKYPYRPTRAQQKQWRPKPKPKPKAKP